MGPAPWVLAAGAVWWGGGVGQVGVEMRLGEGESLGRRGRRNEGHGRCGTSVKVMGGEGRWLKVRSKW